MHKLRGTLVRFLNAEDGPTAVGTNANKVFSNVALNTAVSSS
jgi:hypothetical protein